MPFSNRNFFKKISKMFKNIRTVRTYKNNSHIYEQFDFIRTVRTYTNSLILYEQFAHIRTVRTYTNSSAVCERFDMKDIFTSVYSAVYEQFAHIRTVRTFANCLPSTRFARACDQADLRCQSF